MNRRYYDVETDGSLYLDDDERIVFYEPDLSEYYVSDSEEYYDEDLEEDDDAYESAAEVYFDDNDFSVEPYEQDDSDSGDDSALVSDALREVLPESYRDASEEMLQETLADMLENMTPAEGFNLNKVLRQIGTTGQQIIRDPMVGQVAGTLLPVAGATIGTIYGGPMGGALGGQLGQAAGQVVQGMSKPATRPVTKPVAAPVAKPATGPTPSQAAAAAPVPAAPTIANARQPGSTAAAQLLQLTQDPNVLKSLLALSLGAQGCKSIAVGESETAVNIGSFMNLIGTLADKAAADADALTSADEASTAYLMDSEGEFMVDPAVPEDRATSLYNLLTHTANQQLFGESGPVQPWSDFFPFVRKTKLLVEYQTGWGVDLDIGRGEVLERTRNHLKLNIHIDKNRLVSETDAVFEIQYTQDGPGNHVRAKVNGKEYNFNNITIKSYRNTREVPLFVNFGDKKVSRITLSRVDAGEATLKITIDNEEEVFVLTEK